MDKLKKSLVAAVALSIALVCMLMVFVLSRTKGTKSDDIGVIIVLLALLPLTASAIVQWIRYFKGYVDFAIEQKLKDTNKETKN